jgi:hypothetical protein
MTIIENPRAMRLAGYLSCAFTPTIKMNKKAG